MIYLEARPGLTYETYIARSKDLKRWESSRLNPVLAFSDEDQRIANPKLTAAQRKVIAEAKDSNNSDVDLCEFKGRTILYYSWGNQQGTEFLAEAVYDGTLASFLWGWFRYGRDRRARRPRISRLLRATGMVATLIQVSSVSALDKVQPRSVPPSGVRF
jgi:hypothetical protein